MNTKPTVLYCHKHPPDRNGTVYENFFLSPIGVRACGTKHPVIRVTVRAAENDENHSHWGWWDNERQHFAMIYPAKFLAEMCFTYGSKAEEDLGRGKLMPLVVIEEIVGAEASAP